MTFDLPAWPAGLPYDRFEAVLNIEVHERAFAAASRLAARLQAVTQVVHEGGEVPAGDGASEQTDRWILIAYLAADRWPFHAFLDAREQMRTLVELFAPKYQQPLVVMS